MSVPRAALVLLAGLLALAAVLPVVVLALPLWAVAGLVRALARRLEPPAVPWEEIIRFHPELGWVPAPNLDVHALDLNDDAFRLTTDAEGWRRHDPLDEAEVAVFGDSFAFGHGIDDDRSFAAVADIRIKGVGAPGYNMVQSLLWMERLAPRLGGKTVVWLVYEGNDLDDNLRPAVQGYPAPFVRHPRGFRRQGVDAASDERAASEEHAASDEHARGDEWEIATGHLRNEKWTFAVRGHSYETFVDICRPTELSRRAFDAAGWLIARARKACEAAGARLVVVLVPDLSPLHARRFAEALERVPDAGRFDPGLPARKLAEACAGAGVEFVSLADHLSAADYRDLDVHWTPAGHRKVARVLRRIHAGELPERRAAASVTSAAADGRSASRAPSAPPPPAASHEPAAAAAPAGMDLAREEPPLGGEASAEGAR